MVPSKYSSDVLDCGVSDPIAVGKSPRDRPLLDKTFVSFIRGTPSCWEPFPKNNSEPLEGTYFREDGSPLYPASVSIEKTLPRLEVAHYHC